METQRQWSELAIKRTTPALLSLFSLVTLCSLTRENGAEHGDRAASGVVAQTQPDFLSDALALVRKELWAHATFRRSLREPETVKVPRAFVEHLTETLCYAA